MTLINALHILDCLDICIFKQIRFLSKVCQVFHYVFEHRSEILQLHATRSLKVLKMPCGTYKHLMLQYGYLQAHKSFSVNQATCCIEKSFGVKFLTSYYTSNLLSGSWWNIIIIEQ